MLIGVFARTSIARGQMCNSDQLDLKWMLLSGMAGEGPGETQGGGEAPGTGSNLCAQALRQPISASIELSFPRPASPMQPWTWPQAAPGWHTQTVCPAGKRNCHTELWAGLQLRTRLCCQLASPPLRDTAADTLSV